MVPIYLCDDDPNIRRLIREKLEQEILICGYDMEVLMDTGSPRELLAVVGESGKRGIYFLDVDLKDQEYTGFTLGQALRAIDSRGFLIYVTAYRELAFETFRYKVEALDYIVKENQEEMFQDVRRCLQVSAERMKQEQEEDRPYFTVRFMDTVRHVPMEEILYFETGDKSHRIILRTLTESIDFTGSIQELEQTLGRQFLRVHRAYLVNIRQIRRLDMKERKILFLGGETCYFARNKKKALLRLMEAESSI